MRWVTADHHFGHKNILTFTQRPWKTIEEHDEGLIELWNARVVAGDEVYVVGDFSFQDKWWMAKILKRLNGRKHLILGNHDGSKTRQESLGGWETVKGIDTVDGVVLCHDALGWAIKNGWAQGWPRMFCGHVHEGWRVCWGRFVNVGVDQWGYAPVEWGVAEGLFEP